MSWEDGRYDSGDPQADNVARLAWLRRQRNLGQGWHHGGWKDPDPDALLRQLDEQILDPGQVRAEARRAEARRLHAADRRTLTGHEAVLWLTEFRAEPLP